jgi:hypothetical protein
VIPWSSLFYGLVDTNITRSAQLRTADSCRTSMGNFHLWSDYFLQPFHHQHTIQYNTHHIDTARISIVTTNEYSDRIGPGTCLYLLKEIWCNCLTADGIASVHNNSTAVTRMLKVTEHSELLSTSQVTMRQTTEESRFDSPARARDIFLLHGVQTGSRAHPVSYPMGNGSSFPRVKAAGA